MLCKPTVEEASHRQNAAKRAAPSPANFDHASTLPGDHSRSSLLSFRVGTAVAVDRRPALGQLQWRSTAGAKKHVSEDRRGSSITWPEREAGTRVHPCTNEEAEV